MTDGNAFSIAGLTVPDLLVALVMSILFTGTALGLVLAQHARTPRASGRGRPPQEVDRLTFRDDTLINAPPRWRDQIARLDRESDWNGFRKLLSRRFPLLPRDPTGVHPRTVRLEAGTPGDMGALVLRRRDRDVLVTLSEDAPISLADRYAAMSCEEVASRLNDQLDHLPIPVWTMRGDRVETANAAFRKIETQFGAATEALGPLLRTNDMPEDRPTFSYRAMLPKHGKQADAWVDISARRCDGEWQCSALDVTALVKAEKAQRNFVQTLTKTFAQLSTGLAIFDRERQLILFNPALLDLTQFSPEFLSSRPALSHFFDNLRDRRIMPEPKNYASWRDQINALDSAAADGRYHETWSLPNGATYRVTGRPHPNGAVAFLFEDITDHISMTRRFRQQLSLSQSVLDAFSDAIAIFESDGMMSHCNRAYREMFAISAEADLAAVSANDAHKMWSSRCLSPLGLNDVLSHLVTRHESTTSQHSLILQGTGEVCCTILPLVGGARMVSFGTIRQTQTDRCEASVHSA